MHMLLKLYIQPSQYEYEGNLNYHYKAWVWTFYGITHIIHAVKEARNMRYETIGKRWICGTFTTKLR